MQTTSHNAEQKPTKNVGRGTAPALQAHFSLSFALCITGRPEDPNLKVYLYFSKNKISSQSFGAK